MLSGLLKYEFKDTGRTLLPLYGMLLVCALLVGITTRINLPSSVLEGVLMMLFTILLVATFVMTVIIVIRRFYSNLLQSEGYLMFTLPVKTWQLVASKLLVALVWSILAVIVATLSFLIIIAATGSMASLNDIIYALQTAQQYGMIGPMLNFMLLMITTCLFSILMVYCSMAIGQMSFAYKNKVLFSCLAFLAINVILNFLLMVGGSIIDGTQLGQMLNYGIDFNSMSEGLHIISIVFTCANLINLLFSAIFFFLTTLLLKKKLNLG